MTTGYFHNLEYRVWSGAYSQIFCGGNRSIVQDIHQRVFIFGRYDQIDVGNTVNISLTSSQRFVEQQENPYWSLIGDEQGNLSFFGHINGEGEQNIEVWINPSNSSFQDHLANG
jgi:hypothetical protein